MNYFGAKLVKNHGKQKQESIKLLQEQAIITTFAIE
jgi:hypothetical protein